ncbi:MAG: hypothetical protein H0T91_10325 [Propionibacteriaceae bacterium]|nr:hypothetical protein [Propionibacteriaceae bacterium]
MTTASIPDRAGRLHAGARRDFMIWSAAGLSMALTGTALRATGALAQDATPTGGRTMASASDHYALADDDAEAI